MKLRNTGDANSVEDRRGVYPRPPSKADQLGELIARVSMKTYPKKSMNQPDDKPGLSKRIMLQAKHSASAALSQMGNKPLPSRRAPKGNNPGSVAQMKFPKTSRSK